MTHLLNISIQIIPLTNKGNAYDIIDEAIDMIDRSGLKYKVCPFETVIEGKYDEIMELIKKINAHCLQPGVEELLTNIKIHMKKDTDATMEDKINKYENPPS